MLFVPNVPAKEIVFILVLLPSPSRINASRFFLSRKFAADSHRIAKQVLDLSQQLLQAPLDRREGVLAACFVVGQHALTHPRTRHQCQLSSRSTMQAAVSALVMRQLLCMGALTVLQCYIRCVHVFMLLPLP